MTFDFDQPIEREGTHSLKFDARKAVFGTDDVMPMWVADMDLPSPPEVTEALIERAQHPTYGYSLFADSLYQSLIDWCQKRFQWQIEQNDILMCPGVVPSLQAIVMALTEPGDKVIIQTPVYPPFFKVVTRAERQLLENPLKLDDGRYTMDLAHFEHCAKQGAKLMILCSPHNPVGRVWSRQELQNLLVLADKYQVMIISDEIHADLIYSEYQHLPLASLTESNNIITAIAPSKTFNTPGLGLSSLHIPSPAHKKAVKAVFDSWGINASHPFSMAAYEAAYRHGEDWLTALMSYLQSTRKMASSLIENELPNIQLIEPEGTYLLWLDCRQMDMTDKALRRFFIDKAKVGMNPGITFGGNGSGFMRLNIGTQRKNVERALRQIITAC